MMNELVVFVDTWLWYILFGHFPTVELRDLAKIFNFQNPGVKFYVADSVIKSWNKIIIIPSRIQLDREQIDFRNL